MWALNPAHAAESAAPASAPGAAGSAVASNPQFQIRPVTDAWRTSLPRDADAATQAYMDRSPPRRSPQEVEADRFGLNLAREPHGHAEAILKLTEYRKPDPGPIEEAFFFDHPSARFRVHDAMRWREAMGAP